MTYQVILFDADGMTLVSRRFSDQIQMDYGIPWDKMKPFFSGPFQACKLGRADLKQELTKVIPHWGWQKSVDELIEYWFQIGSELNQEIVDIVRELRTQGVRCYLATNQEKYRAAYLRDVVGLGSLFDGLLVSCDLGHAKNEVEFFQAAYERIGPISKEAILFVDHEQENIAAARRFGFSTYMYHDTLNFKKFILTA